MLTNLVSAMLAVIGAVNLIVSPSLADPIAVANDDGLFAINTLFPSYTTFLWLSIRAYTVQAAFTAYGVPSAGSHLV